MRLRLLTLLAVFIFLFVPVVLLAAMSSTDYYIYADNFDLGGGLSVGGSYNLQDTIGQSPVDISTSTGYEILAGYQFSTLGTISLTVSSSSLNLGTLSSVGDTGSAATVVTVSSDSGAGYVLSVGSVSGTSLNNVTDGAVDGAAGQEEYGVAVSGADSATSTDAGVNAGLVLASSGSASTGTNTTLTFKAARGSATVSGAYSQSLVLTASANF